MSKLSVIIPSAGEQFLPQTIDDIYAKAAGEIEVVVTLDGYWPDPPLPDYPHLKLIHRPKQRGMRASINAAAAVATGKYLMKLDGHCMVAEGFDEVLKADIDGDWIVIPSRYSLEPETWEVRDTGRARVDYHYLCFPYDYPGYKGYDPGLHGSVWGRRAHERKDPEYDIDEEMSFQGSGWVMHRSWFWDFLGGMSEEGYGTFIQEPQEIGLKTWLGGGKVMVNKKTWYAHLHKGKKYGRGYSTKGSMMREGSAYSTDYWMNDRWNERMYDFEWLIDRFSPVPTWQDNWREIVEARRE